MKITLNGRPCETPGDNLTVTDFLAGLETGGQPVLVEVNGAAVLVREFDEHRIREGDVVEVIRMVAGG